MALKSTSGESNRKVRGDLVGLKEMLEGHMNGLIDLLGSITRLAVHEIDGLVKDGERIEFSIVSQQGKMENEGGKIVSIMNFIL